LLFALQYAQRVSTIRNDVSKHENSAEVLRMKKQIDYWKEQAGLPPHKREYVDLEEVQGEPLGAVAARVAILVTAGVVVDRLAWPVAASQTLLLCWACWVACWCDCWWCS
jgi:hypothetical protein